MPDHRVLYFDGNLLSALHLAGRRVHAEGAFHPDPLGVENFGHYLDGHRGSLFYFLSDVGDEGFQIESIPYIQGSDRGALLKRKLGQYYYGTPFSTGISLGREKEGRRDERILFAALTRPDDIQPWLDKLRERSIALSGVYSIPLLLATQAAAFAGTRERCLLITASSGGMRQTYFESGQMHFSRLSQFASRDDGDFARACNAESAKTYQYLAGQRQIRRGIPLPTLVLANAAAIPTLSASCRSTDEIAFEFINLADQARAAGLKTIPEDSRADFLFAQRLVGKPPAHQFAPAEERRFYRLSQARVALRGAALAIVAGTLLFGGRLALQWNDLTGDIAELTQQASSNNQRYQNLLSSLPKVALSPADLRAAITGFEHLGKRQDGFAPLLGHLGAALEQATAVELQRVEWELANSPDPKAASARAAGANAVQGSAPQRPSATSSPVAAGPWFTLTVDGQLPVAMAADQRPMIDYLDQLVVRLQTGDIQASLTRRPIDVESAKTFKSKSDRSGSSGPPGFSLLLSRTVSP